MDDTREYRGSTAAEASNRPFGTQEGPRTGALRDTLNGKGTLDQIAERIMRAAHQAREIGHKLNAHADAVHGPVPSNGARGLDQDRPVATAALDRITVALDELDSSQAYFAEAAGRNSTLA